MLNGGPADAELIAACRQGHAGLARTLREANPGVEYRLRGEANLAAVASILPEIHALTTMAGPAVDDSGPSHS